MNTRWLLSVSTVCLGMVSADAALIAQWNFENNLTNTVSSSYGAVYTGSGSVAYSSDAKAGSKSLEFSNPSWGAAPVDKISILDGGDWGGSSSWTFSAWVKPMASSGTVFSARSVDSTYGLYCDFRGANINVYWDSDIVGTSDKKSTSVAWGVSQGTWSLLTVVFDASSNKIQLYRYTDDLEGLLLLKEATYGVPLTLTNFKLGYNDGTSSGFAGFTGNMDNVSIYNQALSASEIIATIPEPATIGLFGLFAGIVMFLRRIRVAG